MRPTWIRSLTAPETRVLGSLMEKQRTTPDVYPLSLNSLRLACNQSTNREPVVDYDEETIRDALHRLERRGIVRLAGASRAAKYRHLLAEALPMDGAEQALVCVLMLRGAQTPGELKQRAERMHAFAGLDGVHATLDSLIERELVERLERRPGQKEERYVQLLQAEEEDGDRGGPVVAERPAAVAERPGAPAQPSVAAAPPQPSLPAAPGQPLAAASSAALDELRTRIERLEREVAELRGARRETVGEPWL